MRCPYCREEIHDEAVKCPHCQRLLVPKPGWQRRGEEAVATQEVPVGSAAVGTSEREPAPWRPPRDGHRRPSPDGAMRPPRPSPRRGLATFGVFLIVVAAAAAGFLGGLATDGGSVAFVSGDRERVAQLEALAERRLQEIRRLQRLTGSGEEAPTPTPTERQLRSALIACNEAFAVLIEREAALFDDPVGLRGFVQVANRCLAPIGQQVEIPE